MHQRDLSDDAGDAIIVLLGQSSQADSYCPPDHLLRHSLLCKVETQFRSWRRSSGVGDAAQESETQLRSFVYCEPTFRGLESKYLASNTVSRKLSSKYVYNTFSMIESTFATEEMYFLF